MNSRSVFSEKGQAIVYLAIGFIVFLGFVALAIDGGMVLADRRHDQNAADSSSLAGGAAAGLHIQSNQNYTCDDPYSCDSVALNNAVEKAQARALANSFDIGTNLANHNGVTAVCYGSDYDDAYIDVTVDISSTTPSNFLQLIFPQALHNEVEAVTRVDPGGPIMFGNAIVALNDEYCSDPGSQGVIMGGSGSVNVSGGSIFSNGCMRDNGGVTVTITNGLALATDLTHITFDNWDPDPTTSPPDSAVKPEDYVIPTPDCTDHWVSSLPKLPNKLSGLYCISANLTINAGDQIEGTNVTIYVPTGKFTINGTPYVNITAPTSNAFSPAIQGVLIYLPPTNSNLVKLNGDEGSEFGGLIIAPGSTVQLNGNGENLYVGQVIGYNVDITGNANFYLDYDGCRGYIKPPEFGLYK
jgi:hypothetical protein